MTNIMTLGDIMKKILLVLCELAFASPALSEPSWLGGNIIDITSGQAAIFRLNTGVPDNCVGTP